MTVFARSAKVLLTFAAVLAVSGGALAFGKSNPEHIRQLKETRKCENCDLNGAFLDNVNLNGANLTSADLRGASLYLTKLEKANLTYALLEGANLNGANLKGAIGANLTGANTNERTICPSGQFGPCQ